MEKPLEYLAQGRIRTPIGARVMFTSLKDDGTADKTEVFAEGWLDPATKRYIGRRWSVELAAGARGVVPYPLIEGEHGEVRIGLGGRVLPLTQVSAMILGELEHHRVSHSGRQRELDLVQVAQVEDLRRVQPHRRGGPLPGDGRQPRRAGDHVVGHQAQGQRPRRHLRTERPGPARIRAATYSLLRVSMTTDAMPSAASRWASSSPAGPAPTTTTSKE